MRNAIVFSTGALCLIAALAGFRLGQQKLDLGDTAGVIEAVARAHVASHGGTITECLGWLSETGDALNVRCGEVLYRVDRLGRIRQAGGGGI
jgi:hypothetical protein